MPTVELELLAPLLDEHPVAAVVEYVARRLGAGDGERRLEFGLTDGRLRRTRVEHGPIGNTELEQLAARPAG